MAIRIQNLSKKNFCQSSAHSVPHFAVSYPSWWNSNEQQIPQSLSKNSSLKMESPPRLHHDGKHLGLQLPDQESSSVQSVGQSLHEVGAVGGTSSQDQCISSESGQDESCGKGVEGQMKPVFLLSNPDIVFNPSHDYNHSVPRVPYTYADPYFSGLFTAYGPQALPQMASQMVGIAPARVPLPLDLADGPIYVNAKQYHGILRRRQSRAKLEAQNKLVKSRKPYLHESRHLHALNRVRGSGGRFLSTKRLQQLDSTRTSSSHCVSDSTHLHQKNDMSEFESHSAGATKYVSSSSTCSDITSISNSADTIFRQPDRRFSGISSHTGGGMQSSVGFIHSGTQHCASVVR